MNLSFKIGILTKDPEQIKGTTKTLVKLVLAVKEKKKKKNGNRPTQFFNIAVWGVLADNCLKYLRKGSRVAVLGKDQQRSWEDEKGNKRYATEIVASEVEFISTPKYTTKEEVNEETDYDLPF